MFVLLRKQQPPNNSTDRQVESNLSLGSFLTVENVVKCFLGNQIKKIAKIEFYLSDSYFRKLIVPKHT